MIRIYLINSSLYNYHANFDKLGNQDQLTVLSHDYYFFNHHMSSERHVFYIFLAVSIWKMVRYKYLRVFEKVWQGIQFFYCTVIGSSCERDLCPIFLRSIYIYILTKASERFLRILSTLSLIILEEKFRCKFHGTETEIELLRTQSGI